MEKTDYKNVYVFVEQREGTIQSVGLELLGKARDLACSCHSGRRSGETSRPIPHRNGC